MEESPPPEIVDFTERKLNTFHAFFLMVNGALGAGVLNFPYSFLRVGNIKICLTIEFIFAAIIIFSFYMVSYSVLRGNHTSYMGMLSDKLGGKFALFATGIVCLYTLGSCAAYISIVGNQVKLGSTLFIHNELAWYADRRFLMFVVSLVIFLPFLMFKKLSIIANVSIVGAFCCFYIVLVVAIKYFIASTAHGYVPPLFPEKIEAFGVLNLFTTVIFGFQNHLAGVTVLAEMSRRSSVAHLGVLSGSVIFVGFLYGLIGCCGMLTFGTSVNPDILLNYHPKDPAIGVGRFFIALILIASYAMTAYVGRMAFHNIIHILNKHIKKDFPINYSETLKIEEVGRVSWCLSGASWYIACLVIAIFIPNLNKIITYVGGFAGFIILICPAIVYMQHILEEKTSLSRLVTLSILSVIMATLGAFIMGIAFTLPFVDKH